MALQIMTDGRCNFTNFSYDLEDVSNIRPTYRKAVVKEDPTSDAKREGAGAAQSSSMELLGYDWIASMVDNQMRSMYANIMDSCDKKLLGCDSVDDQWLNRQELFDDLNKFRQTNSELCCSQQPLSYNSEFTRVNPTRPTSSVRQLMRSIPPIRTKSSSHRISTPPITYNYTLNSRLFPIRTDILADDEKAENDTANPVILRISIPSNRLKCMKLPNDSYEKNIPFPSRRLTNSISLMGHCY
uniref:Uncharacterized protein n=1 Tax=Trichobilharzia regenti TaxID=157069 RepID=A0AA85JWK2_TRIRE|nr:unnamed protein product [Trichobilharzia regenti]